uniref:Expressed protein n=2 Tax=Oryza sativa subsp. japonica TaxID=39947 RepID=Q8S5W1_ORYSJ|nr:Hypothetical protein [Oryza sativa Japonica Group]ABF93759.1 expressed protein [Oryza sativa Japonica Group]
MVAPHAEVSLQPQAQGQGAQGSEPRAAAQAAGGDGAQSRVRRWRVGARVDDGLLRIVSPLRDELVTQFDQYENEMVHLFQDHTERLHRVLGKARRRQYQSLLGAAEARRMRDKEAEASNAARHIGELEERVARLRAEAAARQAKALADQFTARRPPTTRRHSASPRRPPSLRPPPPSAPPLAVL